MLELTTHGKTIMWYNTLQWQSVNYCTSSTLKIPMGPLTAGPILKVVLKYSSIVHIELWDQIVRLQSRWSTRTESTTRENHMIFRFNKLKKYKNMIQP